MASPVGVNFRSWGDSRHDRTLLPILEAGTIRTLGISGAVRKGIACRSLLAVLRCPRPEALAADPAHRLTRPDHAIGPAKNPADQMAERDAPCQAARSGSR